LRYELVRGRVIADDIAINLSKMGSDCLSIEIYNQKFAHEMIQSIPKASKNKSGIDTTKKSMVM
jgi:hypothetical protein